MISGIGSQAKRAFPPTLLMEAEAATLPGPFPAPTVAGGSATGNEVQNFFTWLTQDNPIAAWINQNTSWIVKEREAAEGSLLDRARGLLAPVEQAGNVVGEVASKLLSPSEMYADLQAKIGPAFARIALGLVALVLLAAAFWLLSNSRKAA